MKKSGRSRQAPATNVGAKYSTGTTMANAIASIDVAAKRARDKARKAAIRAGLLPGIADAVEAEVAAMSDDDLERAHQRHMADHKKGLCDCGLVSRGS